MLNVQNLNITPIGSYSIQQNVTLPEVVILGLLFHRRAQRIGQKTELSLLKIFAELLQFYFHKCCFLQLLRWSNCSCEIDDLEQELIP